MLNPSAAAPTPSMLKPSPIASLSLGGAPPAVGGPQGVVGVIARMLDEQQAAQHAQHAHQMAQHAQHAHQEQQMAIIRAQCCTTPARTPPPPINQALKVCHARFWELPDVCVCLVWGGRAVDTCLTAACSTSFKA